jgi:hypothetical protein
LELCLQMPSIYVHSSSTPTKYHTYTIQYVKLYSHLF